MRQARIRGEGLSYYHCVFRFVDRRFIFGDAEKEHFVAVMRKLEGFLGLRVVTYVVMGNHFHLLVEEPDEETRAGLDRDTLLQRMPILYDANTVRTVKEMFERADRSGSARMEEQILAPYRERMGDVSVFMKKLKQRFSQWYNRRNHRFACSLRCDSATFRWCSGTCQRSPKGLLSFEWLNSVPFFLALFDHEDTAEGRRACVRRLDEMAAAEAEFETVPSGSPPRRGLSDLFERGWVHGRATGPSGARGWIKVSRR